MPIYQTSEYNDYSDLLETMNQSITAIHAFNTLLEMALRSGEDMKDESFGIWMLLDQQRNDLKDVAKALREEFKDMEKRKLEIRDPEKIAEWAGVSKYAVNRVISIATGIVLGPPTERHTDEPPYFLKETANASA